MPDQTECRWCGTDHRGDYCPLVKAYEIDADGKITRVEFLTPIDLQHHVPDKPEEAAPSYPTLPRST